MAPNVNTSIPAPLSQIKYGPLVPDAHELKQTLLSVHVRPGYIFLLNAAPAYTIYETTQGSYSILVSLDKYGAAKGEAYIDDGETQWPTPNKTVIFTASRTSFYAAPDSGAYDIPQTVSLVTILGVPNKPRQVEYQGMPTQSWTYEAEVGRPLHYDEHALIRQQIERLNITTSYGDLNSRFTINWQ